GILALLPERLQARTHSVAAAVAAASAVPAPPPGMWRQFRWEVRGFRMVLDTSHLVCGTPEHPVVSVKLHDRNDELSLCTCLDYFLDNVMENIPELALCMRAHGYVQGCRLVRTHEIPRLGVARPLPRPGGDEGGSSCDSGGDSSRCGDAESGMFDPRAVELNAVMLLRFLQENCSRDGSTYLLHREEGSAHVQLYDLTALSR
ncbi:unnamed protein product, partial [Phaeothamnion confervicola]